MSERVECVERVARALADCGQPWDYKALARVAIKAARPTEAELVQAIKDEWKNRYQEDVSASQMAAQAMLALLTPPADSD